MSASCNTSQEFLAAPSVPDFFVTANIILAVPIILLNLSVLVAIWKTPALHKPSQILLANLALTDFLIGAVYCPLAAISIAVADRWKNVYCISQILATSFSYCFSGVNLLTLAYISIDRFLAIRIKFTYRNVVTNKRLIRILLGGWIYNIMAEVSIRVFFVNTIPSEIFFQLSALYIIVLLGIVTTFYSMAYYHLKKMTSQVSTGSPNEQLPEGPRSFNVSKYRRSFQTMIIVLFVVIFCYVPFSIFLMLKNFRIKISSNYVSLVNETFTIIRSIVIPLLYLWRMKDLRQAAVATTRNILRL